MLDIDGPHEVMAAAHWFADTMKTMAGQVIAVAQDLVPSHKPESPLDSELTDKCGWAHDTLVHAAINCGAKSDATVHQTVQTVNAYDSTDAAGGAEVRRSESI